MNESRAAGTATAEATQMRPQDDPSSSALVEAIARAKQSIESGDLEAGLQAFRDITALNPQIPEVFNNLGAICAAMGLREEAEEAFGRAAELTPEAANPWYNRGLMRFESGNNVGAMDDFQRAAELDPTDPEIRNNVGVLHFQLRQFAQARQDFETALEMRPGYVAAALNLVDVDLAEKRSAQAAERCRELLQNGEEPEVTAKLIECCITAAVEQMDQAAEATRHAKALAGDSHDLAEVLGRIVRARQTLLNQDAVAATAPTEDAEPAPPRPQSLLG